MAFHVLRERSNNKLCHIATEFQWSGEAYFIMKLKCRTPLEEVKWIRVLRIVMDVYAMRSEER